jgi:hypothetical protein
MTMTPGMVAATGVGRARWLRQLPGSRGGPAPPRSDPRRPARRPDGLARMGLGGWPSPTIPLRAVAPRRPWRGPATRAADPSATVLPTLLADDPRRLALPAVERADRLRERSRPARAIVVPRLRWRISPRGASGVALGPGRFPGFLSNSSTGRPLP